MREHGALSRVAVGWGENTVGESAPSEPAACFVGGRISERVEKKRGSHGPGFTVAGPSGGCGSVVRPEPPAHPLLAKLPVPSLSVAEADESLFNPTASPTSVVDFD